MARSRSSFLSYLFIYLFILRARARARARACVCVCVKAGRIVINDKEAIEESHT